MAVAALSGGHPYGASPAAWVFGDSLGDPTADEIWTAAKERPAGVTRQPERSRPAEVWVPVPARAA